MDRCDVCQGRGLIRVAIYRQPITSLRPIDHEKDAVERVDSTYREYPCPECAATIPQERIAVVTYHSQIDSRWADIDGTFNQSAREHAAHLLIAGLMESGFIRFERGPNDNRELKYPLRASIGVVATKHVATLEERIAAHQMDVAAEVAEEAAKWIRIWGSNYTGDEGRIEKGQAVGEIRKALVTVAARRAETPWLNRHKAK